MKKKGFTLIELLAVIVILAVIALIATPLIMGTISKAKMNSLRDSTYGILKAAGNQMADEILTNEGDRKPLVIKNLESETTLVYKGKKPKCGYTIVDGDLETIVLSDGQYVARKNYSDSDVKVSKGTCSEIQTEIAGLEKPIQDGLQAYFDGAKAPVVENGKLVWKDQSGNGRDGELVNFAGKNYYQNHAITFDGTDYIKIGRMDYQKPTLEIVISYDQLKNIMMSMGNLEHGGLALYAYNEQNAMQAFLQETGYILDKNKFQTEKIQLDKKYYLSGKYDGTNFALFENGKEVVYQKSGTLKQPDENTIMAIGHNPKGDGGAMYEPIYGKVYAARIYNRPLTKDEVYHNYIVDRLKYEA